MAAKTQTKKTKTTNVDNAVILPDVEFEPQNQPQHVNYYDQLKVLKYGETKFYHDYMESIDQHKLSFIVSNREIFEPQLNNKAEREWDEEFGDKQKYDPFLICTKYLEKSRSGNVKVSYKQKREVGRLCAVKSLSLQCIPRQIRHTIAYDQYNDVDMVNAHPCILKFICEQNNIPCQILQKYCEDRDGFFKKNNLTKAEGKILMCSIINGGSRAYDSIKQPTKDLRKFYDSEMPDIHEAIIEKHPEEYAKHKKIRIEKDKKFKNHKASFLSAILCDIENKILQVMFEFFGRDKSSVLCFDGIMLRKGKELDLNGCEKMICDKLHIKVKLAVKPFEEAFDLSSYNIPRYEEISLSDYTDYNNFRHKDTDLEIAEEWLNNTMIYIENGGKSFMLTKNQETNDKTNVTKTVYKIRALEDIYCSLIAECKILNPNFDYNYWEEHKDDANKKKIDYTRFNKYLFKWLGKGKGKEPGFLETYIEKGKILIYKNVTFMPYLERLGKPNLKGKFNLFAGYPMEKIELIEIIKFEDSHLYKHIRDELMNGDNDEFNHFLDHIADIIQDPANIKATSHVFITAQGMGKGLMEKFMKNLIGDDHVLTITDIDRYFDKFNGDQAYKLLKIFEEVQDKGKAYKNHDRLKADQAKELERIEYKGKEAVHVLNCARFWYYTNHKNCMFVEGDCRRNTFHEANNRYAQNKEYFKPIRDEIDNVQFCRNAFDFFANRKYDIENVSQCYNNGSKTNQKLNCLSKSHQFLKELVEDGFKISHYGDKVKCTDLSDAFNLWCTQQNTPFSLGTFKTQLQNLSIQESICRCSKEDTSKSRCYIISKDILLEKFRGLLKDPKFEFDMLNDSDEVEEHPEPPKNDPPKGARKRLF